MTEDIQEAPGISRRSMLKRGALVGGAMVWATPVVQSIGSTAFASTGSNCTGYVTTVTSTGACYKIFSVTYATGCCQCVSDPTAGNCSATCISTATLTPIVPPQPC